MPGPGSHVGTRDADLQGLKVGEVRVRTGKYDIKFNKTLFELLSNNHTVSTCVLRCSDSWTHARFASNSSARRGLMS